MPVTFLAHQAPLVPFKRRWPARIDGLALVIGSTVPDLWYVTVGWDRWWGGRSLGVNAHGFFQPVRWIVPTMALVWLVRHVIAPVVPLAFANGRWRLRDYRLLAHAEHPWWATAACGFAGAFVHVGLDAFTHRDGLFVTSFAFMERRLFDIGHWRVKPWWLAQYVSSVVLGAIALRQLAVIGRRRLLRSWHPVDASASTPALSARGVRRVRVVLAASVVAGVALGLSRMRVNFATATISAALVVFAGALVAAWWARAEVAR